MSLQAESRNERFSPEEGRMLGPAPQSQTSQGLGKVTKLRGLCLSCPRSCQSQGYQTRGQKASLSSRYKPPLITSNEYK
jgi:hypothetical protein